MKIYLKIQKHVNLYIVYALQWFNPLCKLCIVWFQDGVLIAQSLLLLQIHNITLFPTSKCGFYFNASHEICNGSNMFVFKFLSKKVCIFIQHKLQDRFKTDVASILWGMLTSLLKKTHIDKDDVLIAIQSTYKFISADMHD